MLNKKELELLKQTGVNDKEVTEKLVNFLRHEFDNVVRVKKEDYNKSIAKLVDNKQGSYTFIDDESGDFLFKISIFNKEVDGENIGLSFIALNKQGWLLTQDDNDSIYTYTINNLLDENNIAYGINLAQQLVEILDGQTIASREFVNNAIEADKDIISQLAPIYNEETGETRIVFPPNVLPLRFYSEETDINYFNYSEGQVLDNNGSSIGRIVWQIINNKKCVVMFIENEFTQLTNTQLTYCYFNDGEEDLNTYELYHIYQKANLNGANFTGAIKAPSIIEDMNGYSFTKRTTDAFRAIDYIYAGAVKNGNKITFVLFAEITRLDTIAANAFVIGEFTFPSSVGEKLIPYQSNWLASFQAYGADTYLSGVSIPTLITKGGNTNIAIQLNDVNTAMTLNTAYKIRIEQTFLLSDNLAS